MTDRTPESPNFGFLRVHDERLPQVGALAERYFADDPDTRLMKLRQLGELMAQELATHMGVQVTRETTHSDLLARLRREGALPQDVARLFYELKNRKRRHSRAARHAPGSALPSVLRSPCRAAARSHVEAP